MDIEWFDCTDTGYIMINSAIISIGISKRLTINQINSIGNLLMTVGQNLEMIAAQKALNVAKCSCKNNSSNKNNKAKQMKLKAEGFVYNVYKKFTINKCREHKWII